MEIIPEHAFQRRASSRSPSRIFVAARGRHIATRSRRTPGRVHDESESAIAMDDERRSTEAGNGAGGTRQAVGAEHIRLGELISRTELALRNTSSQAEILQLAEQLTDSMEAHFAREESLYYPTIWALKADLEPALRGLIRIHADFRARLAALVDSIRSGAIEAATGQLDRFATLFGEHEAAEELVLETVREQRNDY
jgi:hemerythrin